MNIRKQARNQPSKRQANDGERGSPSVHQWDISSLPDWVRRCDVSRVHEKYTFALSTWEYVNAVFQNIHIGKRFRKYTFTMTILVVFVWTKGLSARAKRMKIHVYKSKRFHLQIFLFLPFIFLRHFSIIGIWTVSRPVQSERLLGLINEWRKNLTPTRLMIRSDTCIYIVLHSAEPKCKWQWQRM